MESIKPFSGYKNLVVWKEAKVLVLVVYKITENFPDSEKYSLRDQMRRAVISILSQIAEGWLRKSTKDKLHFLNISLGSLLELESQAEVAHELNFIDCDNYSNFDTQRAKVSYLLFRYTNKIESS